MSARAPSDTIGVFTVGHSNHSADAFVALLERHSIRDIVDVRSTPFSRRHPQFNRETIAATLGVRGIGYLFAGRELGARTQDLAVYRDGRVDFVRLAGTQAFAQGIDRVLARARDARVALMCAEREPLDCHRTLLVARRLVARGVRVHHLLADGGLEAHAETESRLLVQTRCEPPPLFATADDRRAALERAYEIRGRAIAWSRPSATGPPGGRPG